MNKETKHYLIYKITNTVNNKIYVGCHMTNNITDNYMGSGFVLKEAFKKYGKENFTKEILYECADANEMMIREREIVDAEFIKRPDTYNLNIGGGFDSREDRTKPKSKGKNKGKIPVKDIDGNRFTVTADDPRYISGELQHTSTGRNHSDATKKKIGEKASGRVLSDSTKERISNSTLGEKNHFYGKHHSDATKKLIGYKSIGRTPIFSEEHKKKLSDASRGENNSGFNKIWISNPELNKMKRVPEQALTEYLNIGWILGRKLSKPRKRNPPQSKEVI